MDGHDLLPIVVSLGMCVLVPLGIVGGLVWIATKRAGDRHDERMAMIAQGLVPPADSAGAGRATVALTAGGGATRRDPARGIGWAVGFLVAGVLWVVGDLLDLNGFGIILTAIGAAYLTRGVLAMRSEEGSKEGEVR